MKVKDLDWEKSVWVQKRQNELNSMKQMNLKHLKSNQRVYIFTYT